MIQLLIVNEYCKFNVKINLNIEGWCWNFDIEVAKYVKRCCFENEV